MLFLLSTALCMRRQIYTCPECRFADSSNVWIALRYSAITIVSRVVQVISRNHSNVSKPIFIISQVLYRFMKSIIRLVLPLVKLMQITHVNSWIHPWLWAFQQQNIFSRSTWVDEWHKGKVRTRLREIYAFRRSRQNDSVENIIGVSSSFGTLRVRRTKLLFMLLRFDHN